MVHVVEPQILADKGSMLSSGVPLSSGSGAGLGVAFAERDEVLLVTLGPPSHTGFGFDVF
jgi:hypothetical protein